MSLVLSAYSILKVVKAMLVKFRFLQFTLIDQIENRINNKS